MNTLFLAAVGAGAEPGKTGLLETFHVSWEYLVPQLISFFLVIFVLKKFAFGPIQEMLEQRRNRIAEGEEKLKRIEQQLADSEKATKEAIDKANADAQRLIAEAQENAEALTEKKAQEAAKAEQATMRAELKQEFGRLIASTTASVTGKVLNDDDKRRINEEALSSVEA